MVMESTYRKQVPQKDHYICREPDKDHPGNAGPFRECGDSRLCRRPYPGASLYDPPYQGTYLVHGHDGFLVYVDSPLAVEATQVFTENLLDCYDDETKALVERGINPIDFKG